MQGGHPVDGAVRALKELHSSYEALFSLPTDATLDGCRQCHEKAVASLKDAELAGYVATLIKETLDTNQGSVKFALKNLERDNPWELKIERELGGALGFGAGQVDDLIEEAKQGLQSAVSRKSTPMGPDAAASLIEILDEFHKPTIELADSLRKVSKDGVIEQKPRRRPKRKGKNQARKLTDRQLFLVGSIVANGKVSDVFPRSYAISLGLIAAAER